MKNTKILNICDPHTDVPIPMEFDLDQCQTVKDMIPILKQKFNISSKVDSIKLTYLNGRLPSDRSVMVLQSGQNHSYRVHYPNKPIPTRPDSPTQNQFDPYALLQRRPMFDLYDDYHGYHRRRSPPEYYDVQQIYEVLHDIAPYDVRQIILSYDPLQRLIESRTQLLDLQANVVKFKTFMSRRNIQKAMSKLGMIKKEPESVRDYEERLEREEEERQSRRIYQFQKSELERKRNRGNEKNKRYREYSPNWKFYYMNERDSNFPQKKWKEELAVLRKMGYKVKPENIICLRKIWSVNKRLEENIQNVIRTIHMYRRDKIIKFEGKQPEQYEEDPSEDEIEFYTDSDEEFERKKEVRRNYKKQKRQREIEERKESERIKMRELKKRREETMKKKEQEKKKKKQLARKIQAEKQTPQSSQKKEDNESDKKDGKKVKKREKRERRPDKKPIIIDKARRRFEEDDEEEMMEVENLNEEQIMEQIP